MCGLVFFIVAGDVMGPTMNNLDSLLRLPTGCGEQNMMGFAPDVFILKYLDTAASPNPAVVEKAKRFLRIGKIKICLKFKLWHTSII